MLVYVLSRVYDSSLRTGYKRLSDVYGVYATLAKAQENACYAELVEPDELQWERLTLFTWNIWCARVDDDTTWYIEELAVQGLTP